MVSQLLSSEPLANTGQNCESLPPVRYLTRLFGVGNSVPAPEPTRVIADLAAILDSL
jgi:hypothetical protein